MNSFNFMNTMPMSQLYYNSIQEMIASKTECDSTYLEFNNSTYSSTNTSKKIDIDDNSQSFQECNDLNLSEDQCNLSLSSYLEDNSLFLEETNATNTSTNKDTTQIQESFSSQPKINSEAPKIEMDHHYIGLENEQNFSSTNQNEDFPSSDHCKSEYEIVLKLKEKMNNEPQEKALGEKTEDHDITTLNIGKLNEISENNSKVESDPGLNFDNLNSTALVDPPVFHLSAMKLNKKSGNYKKTLRQVVLLLKEWFILRGKEKTIVGKITDRSMTASEAAVKMGDSKKTLDYYQLIIRKAIALGERIQISNFLNLSFGYLAIEVTNIIKDFEGEKKEEFKDLSKSKKVKVGVFEYVMNS